jgi:hypothetical protein
MSELDNTKSVRELSAAGLRYTAPEEYLPRLVSDFDTRWKVRGIVPDGYAQRPEEITFSQSAGRR